LKGTPMNRLMSKLTVAFVKALLAKQATALTEEGAEKIGEEAYRLAGAAYRGTQGKKRKKDAKREKIGAAKAMRGKGNRQRAGEAGRRERHEIREDASTRGR
jgi:hypothetical protein